RRLAGAIADAARAVRAALAVLAHWAGRARAAAIHVRLGSVLRAVVAGRVATDEARVAVAGHAIRPGAAARPGRTPIALCAAAIGSALRPVAHAVVASGRKAKAVGADEALAVVRPAARLARSAWRARASTVRGGFSLIGDSVSAARCLADT